MTWATITTDYSLYLHHGAPTYPDIRAAVGGTLSAVPLRLAGCRVTLYCHEEGKLIGLPPNAAATRMATGRIAGDVVLCGGPDREGNDTRLPGAVLSWLEANYPFLWAFRRYGNPGATPPDLKALEGAVWGIGEPLT